MKKMTKRIAVAFYAVVFLATLYVLFEMRHLDPAGLEDEIFMMSEPDNHHVNAVPTVTVPDSHVIDTYKTEKDQ